VTGWGEKDKLMSLNALDVRFIAIKTGISCFIYDTF